MFNMPKNAFLHLFHQHLVKSTLETQIKAYAVVANVQHAEKRVLRCFHHHFFKTALEKQIKSYAVVASVQHAKNTRFCSVFIINF